MSVTERFEAVIGLEVHAQLLTTTKQFCSCQTKFGAEPNTNICPVCLGLPGALPVLNREAVVMAVRAALALNCEIKTRSVFARKNYFYPDLPKGYQISQFDLPFSEWGHLDVAADGFTRRVAIRRIHLEEDAGKNLHGVALAAGRSVVDLNRAGTPLIEIVTEPDLRTSAEAVSYLKRLREILVCLGVNDGNLEEGSFRCDVNVSVRPKGAEAFGTRVEVKNVNSFRHVQRAIEYETLRLSELAAAGETFRQHTRQWDDIAGRSVFLRDKEGSDDYRYFPDPDLPPLMLEPSWVESQRARLPELPAATRSRWTTDAGLSAYDGEVLSAHPAITRFFSEVIAEKSDSFAKRAANFVMTEVLADTKTSGIEASFPTTAVQLRELLEMVEADKISGKQAKEVYVGIRFTGHTVKSFVVDQGMAQLSDSRQIEEICQKVMAENPKQVASFRAGKRGTLGFLIGQVMRISGGAANPGLANEILLRLLDTP